MIVLISDCYQDDDAGHSQATAEIESCYHQNTAITGQPFGINLDPLRSFQLGYDWLTIFQDIHYLRNDHPLNLRLTMRAQWMQVGYEYGPDGELIVVWDKGPGSYYDQLVQIYDLAAETGFTISLTGLLYGTPDWNASDGWHGPGVPLEPSVWTNFIETMLLDFPGIHDWEIWNEPDLDLSWKGSTGEFAELIYKPAVNLIRNLKPEDTIIAPAWAQTMNYESFEPGPEAYYPLFGWLGSVGQYYPDRGDLKDYLGQIGGMDAFDVWAVHTYADFNVLPERWSEIVQEHACNWDVWLQCITGQDYRTVELWTTEIGVDCSPDGHTEQQAVDFFDYFITDQFFYYHSWSDNADYQDGFNGRDPFLNKMFIYELYDENSFEPGSSYFGLFRHVGQPKPAADLFRDKITAYYQ